MFGTGLDIELAQKIVNNIMKIVPYNINIMDKEGIIIASGDLSRLGKFHNGSLIALTSKEPSIIYIDTELEKKGINVPIIIHDEVIGVIGVSGEPEKVSETANIVKTLAELMIEKQLYDYKNFTIEAQIREFVYEWIRYTKSEYDDEFINRSLRLGIDLNILRVVVIFHFNHKDPGESEHIKHHLRNGEYSSIDSSFNIIALMQYDSFFDERINSIISENENLNCFIGHETKHLESSYQSAKRLFEIAQRLKNNQRVFRFKDFLFESIVYQGKNHESVQRMNAMFAKQDKQKLYRTTLMTFVNNNCHIVKTCSDLFIHKNTLYYRLSKISEITGYNTRNYKELMMLYFIFVANELNA
ncbi:MAG: helix-turn-helix domain-containing protein [Acholeplasmataceae bacterium]|nr:helix-turn-helix domain-containing protein [Acholeplasmataceae bacterium]